VYAILLQSVFIANSTTLAGSSGWPSIRLGSGSDNTATERVAAYYFDYFSYGRWYVGDGNGNTGTSLFLKGNEPGKKYLQRLAHKHGKAKALSILAHKLGRAVYFMLKRKEPFKYGNVLRSTMTPWGKVCEPNA
jgi:hypothetical protein